MRLAAAEAVGPVQQQLAAVQRTLGSVERNLKRARSSVTNFDDVGKQLVVGIPCTVPVNSIIAARPLPMLDILPADSDQLQRTWDAASTEDALQVSYYASKRAMARWACIEPGAFCFHQILLAAWHT